MTNKPRIIYFFGRWECGLNIRVMNGVMCGSSDLTGTGSTPGIAYRSWCAKAEEYKAWLSQPFQYGDIVRQGRDEALVRYADPNGALDVVSMEDGTAWEWSARMCELVRRAEPDDIILIPTRPAAGWWQRIDWWRATGRVILIAGAFATMFLCAFVLEYHREIKGWLDTLFWG